MSICLAYKARQLSMGDRVQACNYVNNKIQWKFGTIIKKFGQLHYLILKLNDDYKFKRHIDQLRSAEKISIFCSRII